MTSFVEILTLAWDPLTGPGEPQPGEAEFAVWASIIQELMGDEETLVKVLVHASQAVHLLLRDLADLKGVNIEDVRRDLIERIARPNG